MDWDSRHGQKEGELNIGTKITRERDGRMESYMVSTKITRAMAGGHKNNSPKGWGQMESDMVCTKITRQMTGWHKNNSQWHKNNWQY